MTTGDHRAEREDGRLTDAVDKVLERIGAVQEHAEVLPLIVAWVDRSDTGSFQRLNHTLQFAGVDAECVALIAGDETARGARLQAAALRLDEPELATAWLARHINDRHAVFERLSAFLAMSVGGLAWMRLFRFEWFRSLVFVADQRSSIGDWLVGHVESVGRYFPDDSCYRSLMGTLGEEAVESWLTTIRTLERMRGGQPAGGLRGWLSKDRDALRFWNGLANRGLNHAHSFAARIESQEVARARYPWILINNDDFRSELMAWARSIDLAGRPGADGHQDDLCASVLQLACRTNPTNAAEACTMFAFSGMHRARLEGTRQLLARAEVPSGPVLESFRELVRGYSLVSQFGSQAPNWTACIPVKDDTGREKHLRDAATHLFAEALDWVTPAVAIALRTDLAALLGHPCKPVRAAAIDALSVGGDEAIDALTSMLISGTRNERCAAARVLGKLGTPAAVLVLEGRLERESSETVRDVIVSELDRLGLLAVQPASDAAIRAGVSRLDAKLKGPWCSWLKVADLPNLIDQHGKTLQRDLLAYLLWKQSGHDSVSEHPSAHCVWKRIDRGASKHTGVVLLDQYLASGKAMAGRWSMTCAALIGGEQVARRLGAAVREFAEAQRWELAEHAFEALAAMKDDAGFAAFVEASEVIRLHHPDASSVVWRATELAARTRGLSVDEFGDLILSRGIPSAGGKAPDRLSKDREGLAEHDITPLIPQLDRPVAQASQSEQGRKSWVDAVGTKVDFRTFRHNVDRLGWQRGPINEMGTAEHFHKCFPQAGVHAVLRLTGFHVNGYSPVWVQEARFVRVGSVRVLSDPALAGRNDIPLDDDDSRVLAFGAVPPVAFSEAMADLNSIAGGASEVPRLFGVRAEQVLESVGRVWRWVKRGGTQRDA